MKYVQIDRRVVTLGRHRHIVVLPQFQSRLKQSALRGGWSAEGGKREGLHRTETQI